MAKFRKNDLKLIVKELVRESLLEILAEEYIEEATFRAVESASGQIVGTVTKQINHQLKPIMEHIQGAPIGQSGNRVSASNNIDNGYIQTLDEDYGSVSVSESLGLSDLADPDSMESIISNVRAQMEKEREAAKSDRDAPVTSQIDFGEDYSDLPGPTPTKKTEGFTGSFQDLIKSSAETLREQRQSSVNDGMYDISDGSARNNIPMSNYINKIAQSNKMKDLLDKANAKAAQKKSMGSSISKPSQMAAQQHMNHNLNVKNDPMLDRPAHEVSKYAKPSN